MALLVEKLWNDLVYTLEIVGPEGSVKGLIASQLNLGVKNSWSNWEQEFKGASGGGLPEGVKKLLVGTASLAPGEVGDFLGGLATASTRQLYHTVLFWKDTEVSGLSVSFIVINFDGNKNPLKTLKTLANMALPVREGFVLYAPHKYKVDIAKADNNFQGGEGTLSFRYSNWFEAMKYFVLTNFDCKFSDEKTRDGYPLYGEFTVTLEPFIEVTRDVFLSWLKLKE